MKTTKKFILPAVFRKWGFSHTLLKQDGLKTIYKKTRRKYVGYEVMLFKEHGPYTLAGVNFPAGISMPSTEMWGQRGWSYQTLSEAEAKFKKLL